DGVVPASASDIGGPDGAFGASGGGQIYYVGTNNVGGGYNSKAYLTVSTPGQHTVNVFIRVAGLLVDSILLTTNIDYEPGPYVPGQVAPNLPHESLAPAASLSVALAQPASGKSFANGTNSVVTLVAKPATNGAAVTKVEFFAKLLPSGSNSKIGQAT